MSSVFFELETMNPNFRETYFKIKNYANYIANSEYVIRNENTSHGLFGIVEGFENIQEKENIESIKEHIRRLAERKVPIIRGVISLKEYDAERLGYYDQNKWKSVFENKLPSIADKLNAKLKDIQYVGAVHIEEGHPHFQFMLWVKSEEKRNYFVKYQLKDKLRKEFTNDIFREDLLPIYQEKDFAKKNITSENYLLQQLKKVSTDENTLKELMQYEKSFEQTKFVRNLLKDKQLKEIVEMLIDLKKDLKETKGSIKYQYLKKYPEIIEKVDIISELIINSSIQCKIEINKYIKAKQKLLEFQYTNFNKLEKAKEDAKKDAEQEITKLIGNQILDIERKWLNTKEDYTNIKYTNESINLLDNILTLLYFQAENQKKYNKNIEMKYKKQLSKQAKKEYAIRKANASSFDWDDDIGAF